MWRKALLWLSAVLLFAALVGGIALAVHFAQPDDAEQEVNAKHNTEPPAVANEGQVPRRIAVTGAPGFFVVIGPDGASYIESPDGARKKLADADRGPEKVSSEPVFSKVMKRLEQKKAGLGQLVVCDEGVVDVPKGAIITFVGKDKVVTHNADGSSTVYFTDGRIVQRDRKERRVLPAPK